MPSSPRRTRHLTAIVLGVVGLASCSSDSPTTSPDLPSTTPRLAASLVDVLASIRINEVESNLGTPGDWIELVNISASPIDLSGYRLKDNDDTRTYAFPSGTIIPANGFLVAEEAQFGFGLGAADAARLFAPDGATLIDSYTWTSHASVTYGRCPDGSGAFTDNAASTKGMANVCSAVTTAVKINEVESNGGSPGDWVELFNTSSAAVDLTGYVFRDNDDAHAYTLPSGTSIPANGFLVLDEAQFGFGLGADESARFYAPGGVTIVDSYSWTTHASTTYGRCPDGTGSFVTTTASTKGAANACVIAITYLPWPGDQNVTTADPYGVLGGNMSGLFYQSVSGVSGGVVWAVKNGPGTLYRLTYAGGAYTPRASRTWSNGKTLRYPDGTGDVDAEGLTVFGNSAYVSAERNNANNSVSRNSILRFDVSIETGPTLVAAQEWNLTADLPANGANLGLEAITRIPDSFLVAQGFFDESRAAPYDPANYPNHQGGLFFVGVEATGNVYAYALDHVSGAYTRIATFSSGFPAVMELQFDGELGQLWSICDDTCNGRSHVLRIDTRTGSTTRGRFSISQRFERPAGMLNLNNEGFTFAPLSECVEGRRTVLWSDDGATAGFALRRGSVTCSPF